MIDFNSLSTGLGLFLWLEVKKADALYIYINSFMLKLISFAQSPIKYK